MQIITSLHINSNLLVFYFSIVVKSVVVYLSLNYCTNDIVLTNYTLYVVYSILKKIVHVCTSYNYTNIIVTIEVFSCDGKWMDGWMEIIKMVQQIVQLQQLLAEPESKYNTVVVSLEK